MAFTPVETIALIVAILILVKMAVVFSNKKKWSVVVKKVYGNPDIYLVVFSILGLIVFYYLIQELTIVQIFAVVGFVSLLMGLAFLQFSKDFLPFALKMLNKKIPDFMYLYGLLWAALSVWVIYSLLA